VPSRTFADSLVSGEELLEEIDAGEAESA